MTEDEWKRETLVRHVAKLPKHQISQWLNAYEAKHPRDKQLREEVRIQYLEMKR